MSRPFDEARYKTLLDGLEAAEVRFRDTFKSSETFRLDGEFYKKEFLQDDFKKLQSFPFSDVCTIKSGTTPIDRDDELREGILLLKTTDIRNGVLSKENVENFYFISREIADRMKETKLQSGDVLLNIVGATTEVIGRTAFVPNDFPEANITQAMAFLRLTDKRIMPAYLFSFLAGKYGNKQVRRYARPTGQFNLNLQEVGKFQIPLLDLDFQKQIEKTIKTAHAKLEQSKRLYAEAEETLLEKLGFKNWKPNMGGISIQTLSSSLGESGRLDAEYYQPIYTSAMKILASHSYKPLGEIAHLKKGSQAEVTDEGILYASIKDVHGMLIEPYERANEDDLVLIKPETVALAITGATIGKCGINATNETLGISGDLVSIKGNVIKQRYLLTVLSSEPMQLLCKQGTTGATNGHLQIDHISSFPIPILPDKAMNLIDTQTKKAIQSHYESKRLLEISKRAVEVSIERGESAGMKVLEGKG